MSGTRTRLPPAPRETLRRGRHDHHRATRAPTSAAVPASAPLREYSFEGIEVHDPGIPAYLYLHPIYAPHSEGKLWADPS